MEKSTELTSDNTDRDSSQLIAGWSKLIPPVLYFWMSAIFSIGKNVIPASHWLPFPLLPERVEQERARRFSGKLLAGSLHTQAVAFLLVCLPMQIAAGFQRALGPSVLCLYVIVFLDTFFPQKVLQISSRMNSDFCI